MKHIYPKCANTFRQWYQNNKQYEYMYNFLGKPRPFDVSLRDGLQSLTKDEQSEFSNLKKILLYYEIKDNHNPLNIEIGSLVSKKVLPIFEDSTLIFNYLEKKQSRQFKTKTNHFMLIPNEKQFDSIGKFNKLTHYSFITSVSESFQQKNTKMSLDTTYQQLSNMCQRLDDSIHKSYIKIYVSCINECPIEGKISNDKIIKHLIDYNKLKPDNLCLSDTCGTLNVEDFEYILKNMGLKSSYLLKEKTNLSLHLHVKPGREDEVEKIIHKALDYGIIDFDVSILESGGCSVTMDKSKLAPNLSYDLYYKSICDYIISESEK